MADTITPVSECQLRKGDWVVHEWRCYETGIIVTYEGRITHRASDGNLDVVYLRGVGGETVRTKIPMKKEWGETRMLWVREDLKTGAAGKRKAPPESVIERGPPVGNSNKRPKGPSDKVVAAKSSSKRKQSTTTTTKLNAADRASSASGSEDSDAAGSKTQPEERVTKRRRIKAEAKRDTNEYKDWSGHLQQCYQRYKVPIVALQNAIFEGTRYNYCSCSFVARFWLGSLRGRYNVVARYKPVVARYKPGCSALQATCSALQKKKKNFFSTSQNFFWEKFFFFLDLCGTKYANKGTYEQFRASRVYSPVILCTQAHFVWASTLAKNRKIGKKKFFFPPKFRPLTWVFGHRKVQKNAKIGCFDHLWLHKTHFCVQAYTNTVVIQGDF